jgi:hypothetical protein
MSLGEDRNTDPRVVGLEVRMVLHSINLFVQPYGVINGGFEVMRAAWQKQDHVFIL